MTPQDQKNSIRKLYEAGSSVFDLGDYNLFQEKMANPESRKKFYDSLSQHYDLGGFDEFESKISGIYKQPEKIRKVDPSKIVKDSFSLAPEGNNFARFILGSEIAERIYGDLAKTGKISKETSDWMNKPSTEVVHPGKFAKTALSFAGGSANAILTPLTAAAELLGIPQVANRIRQEHQKIKALTTFPEHHKDFEVSDFIDPNWWSTKGATHLPATLLLLGVGSGGAAIAGRAGGRLATAFGATEKGAKIAKAMSMIFGGGVTSAGTEAFMESAEGFEQTRDMLLRKGESEEKANKMAGEVAANVFQRNIALLLGTNTAELLGVIFPRIPKEVRKSVLRYALKATKDLPHSARKALIKYGTTAISGVGALSESAEEVLQGWFQSTSEEWATGQRPEDELAIGDLLDKIKTFDPQTKEEAAVGLVMGLLFQGAGNIHSLIEKYGDDPERKARTNPEETIKDVTDFIKEEEANRQAVKKEKAKKEAERKPKLDKISETVHKEKFDELPGEKQQAIIEQVDKVEAAQEVEKVKAAVKEVIAPETVAEPEKPKEKPVEKQKVEPVKVDEEKAPEPKPKIEEPKEQTVEPIAEIAKTEEPNEASEKPKAKKKPEVEKPVYLTFTDDKGKTQTIDFKSREVAEEWVANEKRVFPEFINNPQITETQPVEIVAKKPETKPKTEKPVVPPPKETKIDVESLKTPQEVDAAVLQRTLELQNMDRPIEGDEILQALEAKQNEFYQQKEKPAQKTSNFLEKVKRTREAEEKPKITAKVDDLSKSIIDTPFLSKLPDGRKLFNKNIASFSGAQSVHGGKADREIVEYVDAKGSKRFAIIEKIGKETAPPESVEVVPDKRSSADEMAQQQEPDKQKIKVEISKVEYETPTQKRLNKKDFETKIRQLEKENYIGEGEAELAINITDAIASRWATWNNAKSDDFYSKAFADVESLDQKVPIIKDEFRFSLDEQQKARKGKPISAGQTEFLPTGAAIIRIFKHPKSASRLDTLLHELSHVFVYYLPEADIDIASQWANGAVAHPSNWTREAHEKFARAWEKYLLEGKSPTKELEPVFEKLKQILADIYSKIIQFTGAHKRGWDAVALTPEIRDVFDRVLGAQPVSPGERLTIGQEEIQSEPERRTEPLVPPAQKEPERAKAEALSEPGEELPTRGISEETPTAITEIPSEPGREIKAKPRGKTRKGGEQVRPESDSVKQSSAVVKGVDSGGVSVAEREPAVDARAGIRRDTGDYRISADDTIPTGKRDKFRANIEAIKLLKKLENEGRNATKEEQQVLIKYVGWGGLAQEAFSYRHEHEKNYAKEREEIESILTNEEFSDARSSTINAHYTSHTVVSAIYDALHRLGFKGGRIIEPGAGIGNFIGLLPDQFYGKTVFTAIEMDSISARILKKLYPSADVRQEPYQDTRLPDNFYDAAIGNVPFGDVNIYDPEIKKKYGGKFSIHNFFILKSLEKIRPGGVISVITSRYTMDSTKNKKFREILSRQADLIGAIRLPQETFKDNASTEVVTDILFFKKREPGETASNVLFVETADIKGKTKSGEVRPITVNEYYAKNPQMMVGEASLEGSMYGADEPTWSIGDKANISNEIRKRIENLPENIISAKKPKTETTKQKADTFATSTNTNVKVGNFTIIEGGENSGQIGIVEDFRVGDEGELIPNVRLLNISSGKKKLIKDFVGLRDAIHEVYLTQSQQQTDTIKQSARGKLNKAYDKFVKSHGLINSKAVEKEIKDDPDSYLALALEKYDAKNNTANKTDIFTKDVIRFKEKPSSAKNPADALAISLAETGKINTERIADLLNVTEADAIKQILSAGIAFENPSGGLETADEYLSGDVRSKLETAKAAAKVDEKYKSNIDALESVQPKDFEAHQIRANLGAAWIDEQVVEDFLNHIAGSKNGFSVSYVEGVDRWVVRTTKSYGFDNTRLNSTFGTNDYNAVDLIDNILNYKNPKVYTKTEDGSKILDRAATAAATAKMQEIKNEFREWIFSDEQRRDEVISKFNKEFNKTRLREYDGSHLTFDGMNQLVKLDKHQKNAVWRMLNGNTLLGHVVGAGKTYSMIAAAMEGRRTGLFKKPMFAVRKHMLGQFASDFKKLYPNANIIVADEQNFSGEKRKKFMARVATGDFDGVIVTHPSLKFIPLAKETEVKFIQQQQEELEEALVDLVAANEKGRGKKDRTVKQIEKQLTRLEERIKELKDTPKDNVTFENMGIDMLFVDESQNFKNLFYTTKLQQVLGLGKQEGGKESFDLFMKTRHIMDVNGGERGVIFATGTPISNTMAELYLLMKYLSPITLKNDRLAHFDAWSKMFAEIVTAPERTTTGKFEPRTRLAKFMNLPALFNRFRKFADIKTHKDLPDLVKILPKWSAESPVQAVAEASSGLTEYMQGIIERAELLKTGKVDPRIDNFLNLATDARKAGLDLRLVLGKDYVTDAIPKVELAAKNIAEIYEQHRDKKATQIVFCDLSAPDKKKWNVYDELKKLLIKKGVPANEIAFIHDANTDIKKLNLFQMMNSGEVRILMGSTPKLGEGTNVQEKLIAIHHLDAPWRPSDIEQRNGRIYRRNNTNDEIIEFRYATDRSFDSNMWQKLAQKQRFITQMMTSETSIIEAEDISESDSFAKSAQEMMAITSGDPRIVELVNLKFEQENIDLLFSSYQANKIKLQKRKSFLPRTIQVHQDAIKRVSDIISISEKNKFPEDEKKWEAVIDGEKITGKSEILEKFDTAKKEKKLISGTFRGLKFITYDTGKSEVVDGEIRKVYHVRIDHETTTGNYVESRLSNLAVSYLNSRINELPELKKSLELAEKDAEKELTTIQAEIDKKFSRQKDLDVVTGKIQSLEKELGMRVEDEEASSGMAGGEEEWENSKDLPENDDDLGRPNDDILGMPTAATGGPRSVEKVKLSAQQKAGEEYKPYPAYKVIEKLSAIVEAAGESVPIRVGSFPSVLKKTAKGFFKIFPRVIRIKSAFDINTASHEVAHALEVAIFGKALPWKRPAIPQAALNELSRLGKDLYGEKKPSGGYRREGFAEYVSYYLITDLAKTKAPEFTKYFESEVLDKNPKVKAAIVDAKESIEKWKSQGAISRAMSGVVRGDFRDYVRDPAMLAKRAKQATNTVKIKKHWVDAGAPLEHIVDQAQEALGRELKIEEDPYKILSALRLAHGGRVRYMIEKGMIDIAGNKTSGSLRDATALIKNKREEFTIYLWARRALELIATDRNPGMAVEDAEYIKSYYENQPDGRNFELAANKIYEWNQGILKYALQGNLITTGLYNKLIQSSQNYIPLKRHFDDLNMAYLSIPSAGDSGRILGNNPIFRLKGSGRRIKDPFQSMIDNAERMTQATHKKIVLDAVVKLAGIEGMGKYIEKIPRDMVPTEVNGIQFFKKAQEYFEQQNINIELPSDFDIKDLENDFLTVFTPALTSKSGKPVISVVSPDHKIEWYWVDEEAYRTLNSMDIFRLHPVLEFFFAKPARAFRLGTTGLRASFSLFTNPIRDFATWLAQTKSQKSNPLAYANAYAVAMKEALFETFTSKETKFFDAFQRLGGELALPLYQDTRPIRRAAAELFQGKIIRTIKHPIEHLRDVLQIPESATRVAELKLRAEEVGWDGQSPITLSQSLQLLLDAKRATIDFTAAGEFMRVINQVIPFSNATIQGARSFGRTIGERPVKSAVVGASLALMTLGLWAVNRRRDWYKDMPYRERYMYWHFETSWPKPMIIRLPKPIEWGAFFSVIPEAIFDSMEQTDQKAAAEAAEYVIDIINPGIGKIEDVPVPFPENPVITLLAEQAANKRSFGDRPIIGQALLKRPPAEQYTPYTTDLAKWIGKRFDVSPLRIDHAIQTLSGGALQDVGTNASFLASVAAGKNVDLADIPVIGRGIRRGGVVGFTSKSVDEFYDTIEKVRLEKNKRSGETELQRQQRLLLEDAAKALTALFVMRNNTSDFSRKIAISEKIKEISQKALAEYKSVTPAKRAFFKQQSKIFQKERKSVEQE